MTFNTGLRMAVSLALFAGSSSIAFGQDAAKLFAKPAEYQAATMSPSGEYVAVSTPFEERRALSIIKLSGSYDRSLIKFDVKEQPSGAVWTDDSRIIVQKAKDYGLFGSLYATGDVYAANADATEQVQLFGYVPDHGNIRTKLKDEGSVTFMKLLPGTKGEALFYFWPWTKGNSKSITSVYRVDTHSGARKQVESFPESVAVVADNGGQPRFTMARDVNGLEVVRYRQRPGAEWTPAPATLSGIDSWVWRFDPDNDHAYAQISDKGEPASLYRISVSEGTREKLVGNPQLEVSSFEEGGFMGPPMVVGYDGGRPKIDYVDPKSEWSQLHAGLMKAFPGQLVSFVDFTRDNRKLLFFVGSDRHPGAYYLLDRDTKTPQLLFETMEWIDPAKMSPVTPIEFKNRGGDTLFGFYTAPIGKKGPHPLVVMPHGGPFGVHDTWTYDSDVQFLASLGYAVLQVNYRGSSSRGDAFHASTFRQWGTGIQDDITDGVKHLISQNLVDAGRVCIYGISFGGYSAMMNPIRNPGMYKCAIGYAGVYDLAKMQQADDSTERLRSWFAREVSNDPAQVAAQSPTVQVAKLDAPILLIHGKSDTIAPFEQFTAAKLALSQAGKTYETLEKASEGHGFYKEANRVEAYERIRSFLLKYNPPG